MSFQCEFDPETGAVAMSCDALGDDVTWVDFHYWRSGDARPRWVRGGWHVPVNAGATLQVRHHDWPPGPDGTPLLRYAARLSTGQWEDPVQVTPSVFDQAWIKWLGFPFLNRRVMVVAYTDPRRDGRGALLEVTAARAPIAVGEVMGPLRFEFTVRTATWQQWRDLDRSLSVGGVMMLHADEERLGLPAVYFQVDDVHAEKKGRHNSEVRYTTIALHEVAEPSHHYAGAISTWQTVLRSYQSWADLVEAAATWGDVVNMPAVAGDVVVED
ncbi:hypothetical protein Ae168Ps1_6392c [Pseudonocardia sp. Ae168_Ps1]|uniref:hypothetical protein n=1 Tax=unclassified Pseudonocardia TaxID=2619320 RepID=UPI00094AEEA1|nr:MULTISPECIES: hypothetical protein [unclassified Pseudonocardia]OLL69835.1 hypothetical protein Ae150APs1_6246c [Pseudonocardia sp. Ae150A_Ps1]OLL69967.1 hypothetical protein Ae168Ps1_6392c [Pseudonocardia sp. Ae168_Ps1]OLL89128.1 hypothetical protein Ae356Ps1_6245c [Pseudonocardia sp. Ae356_Ps1]